MHIQDGLGELRRLNWRPSLPSIFAVKHQSLGLPESELPKEVDLESEFTATYDQERRGTCVDNGGGALLERLLLLSNYPWKFRPSRLFMYWNARGYEGTQNSDAGSTISDWVRAVNEFGVCPEIEADGTNPNWLWTYDGTGDKYLQKPPEQCYKDAVLHKLLKDEVLQLQRNDILNAIAARKPFVFGFTVHKSFMTQEMAQTGVMHVPGKFDLFDNVVGGHGVDVMGYKLGVPMGSQGVVDWAKVRNSWGPKWGQNGYFWMPLDQILCDANTSSDAHIPDLVGA